jgi:hypothetical protein
MATMKIKRIIDLVKGTVEIDDDEIIAMSDKIISERQKHVPLIDCTVYDEGIEE